MRAKKRGSRTVIGLVAGLIVVCALISLAVGAWIINAEQEQREKEQTALAIGSTQTSVIRGTSTEEARFTENAQASLTEAAGGTATIQARDRVTAEAQATITAGVQQTASAIVQKTEAALEAIQVTAQAPATWFIEPLNSTVTSLNFYYKDASDEKVYGDRFDQDVVDYMYYELNLDHNTTGYSTFTLRVIYYFPDGSIEEFTSEHYREAEWNSSWHSNSYGWDEVGNFPIGTYQVDLFMEGVKIATGTFEIYD